jgi:cell shape-determining protein MreC
MEKGIDTLHFSVKPFVVWIGLCGLLWLISPLPPVIALTGTVERALVSTSGVGQGAISMVTWPVRFGSRISTSTRRIADLEQRLAVVVMEKAELEEYKRKEAEMAALINVPLPAQFAVQATARMAEGAEGKILTAGIKAGVEPGMLVVDTQGVLMGIVGDVGIYVSRLITITRLSKPLPVTILGKSIPGVLMADGTVVRLTNVAQGAELAIGDVVVTDGLDGNFPPSLVIGQVMNIESKPAEVLQTALIELLAKPEGEVLIGR